MKLVLIDTYLIAREMVRSLLRPHPRERLLFTPVYGVPKLANLILDKYAEKG
jgi:hypothetical protein